VVGGVDHERDRALLRQEDGLRKEFGAIAPPVHIDDAGERTLSPGGDQKAGNTALPGAEIGDVLNGDAFQRLLGAHAKIE
jgi:hypothetical protein